MTDTTQLAETTTSEAEKTPNALKRFAVAHPRIVSAAKITLALVTVGAVGAAVGAKKAGKNSSEDISFDDTTESATDTQSEA